MGKDALHIGANTFAFFTRNPRGGKAKDIDENDVKKLLQLMKENEFGKLVAHAPYTLNPCSKDEKVRAFAEMAMADDLARMEYLPGNYYNFHPGSHVGQGVEVGITLISDLLNKTMLEGQSTTVLLETMAGKGSEVGSNFKELGEIIRRTNLSENVGICLDTCHVSDAGYDIKDNLEIVLDGFDQEIGLEKLKALHINDSLNPLAAHKDRHARIGEGYLGTETILGVINHPVLKGLPCILETPQENLDGYREEIKMLRERSEKEWK